MSCLTLKITLGERARMTTSLLSAPMIAHVQLGNPPLRMTTRIVCGLPDYDWDIVSMLFNDLMIGNKTLLINGDSSVVIRELESSTRILNRYYFKN